MDRRERRRKAREQRKLEERLDIAPSLAARFLDAFLKSFRPTFKESILHALILIGTLVYWLLAQRFSMHFWESVVPWLWAIFAVVVWHLFKSAHLLVKQIEARPSANSRTSLLVSQYGEPLELPNATVPRNRTKVYGIAAGITLGIFLCAILVWEAAQSHETAQSSPAPIQPPIGQLTPVTIVADCQISELPIVIPPHTVLHLLDVNRKRMLSLSWGLADIPNSTDKQVQWPSKQKMQEASRRDPLTGNAYKCDFTNHSQVGVLDVAVPMRFWFNGEGGDANAVKYTPILSPLDAGQHFTLYAVNDCPVQVGGVLPDTVRISVAGESERRNVPLNVLHRTPTEQIMMFFPTTTQWIGETPCG